MLGGKRMKGSVWSRCGVVESVERGNLFMTHRT